MAPSTGFSGCHPTKVLYSTLYIDYMQANFDLFLNHPLLSVLYE